MDLHDRIAALIEPSLTSLGYDLVRVQVQGRQRMTLQIMAERKDAKAMTVDDCTTISRTLSAILDVEDPIDAAYMLEVSSPGIDRPLIRPADYDRFKGFEAKIETHQPLEGRKRFKGRLHGIDDAALITMRTDEGLEVAIPFALVQKAKLVLTDDLIAATVGEGDQENFEG